MVHQKPDGIAVLAATKAMEKLFGRTDRKTGRFFAMKWAETHEISAPFFQLDIASHHLHDIYAGEQFLNKGLRNGHGAIFPQVCGLMDKKSPAVQGSFGC
jgi:hypothetical protein